jgi:sec-independent protein translocase protein TatC
MAEQTENSVNEMSFLDHLEVLRWHLVRSFSVILIAAIGAFVFKGFVFDTVIFGPKRSDFITYRLLCRFSDKMSEILPAMFPDGAICIGQNLPSLVNLTMAGQFSAHIMTSIIAGIIIAFPYIVWEVWRFIKPGLAPSERKYARGFVSATSFLFLTGVAFGYYVISPLSVNFFLNYQVSTEVLNNPTLETYISLVTTVVLACGAVFELPVLIFFLTKAGIVSPKVLKAFRRHAIVGALVLSAVITPPDIFSQILVTIPIIILYEISIWISGVVVKRQAN